MNTILLALRGRTLITGRFLAQALNIRAIHRPPVGQCDLLIRWGNSATFISCEYVINSSGAVANAARKDKALWLMAREGVKVPDFLRIEEDTTVESLAACIPGFLRSRYHQGGDGLKFVPTLNACEVAMKKDEYTYIVKEINKIQEWRVHVGSFMGAELLYVQRKLRQASAEPSKVWNYDNGWTFNTRAPSSLASYLIIDEAKRAVEALGLDFGAVDLLVDAEGTAWVIEVNTAPALTIPTSQGSYIKFFEEARANVQNCLRS